MDLEFDYIIVGAGSAGCVLANRLSADGNNRVLLLEAGASDNNPLIQIPLMTRLLYTMPSLNWGYDTWEQQSLHGRRIHWPRGKVLGGSSSINGMVYIRGHPSDFDRWHEAGCTGWSFEDVLPYFKRSERHVTMGDPYHGSAGELPVGPTGTLSVLEAAFVEACEAAGMRKTQDFNSPPFAGAGFHDFTMYQGRRQSTSKTFLKPALGRKNLDITTRAHVEKIIFENKRAVGVQYRRSNDRFTVSAKKEIILAAGVVNSPTLLMQSGVGDGDSLRSLDIPVVSHLPGVGKNLQDHLGIYVSYECLRPIGLRRLMRPDRAAVALLQALLFATGPGSTLPLRCCGIDHSTPGVEIPDIKMTMIPALVVENPWKRSKLDGYAIHAYQLRPQSRGHISIRSPDPDEKPLIDPKYLSHEKDRMVIRHALFRIRDIARQSPLSRHTRVEIAPGDEEDNESKVDDWIARNATTAFHPVGTCKMGIGLDAVVNPNLHVQGVDALRVIDASIMPAITSGNTNAPTIMIAEKGSDLIIKDN